MLSDEQIAKYQAIYKSHYGEEISRQEALEQGIKLVRLIELIYRPLTEKDWQLLKKRREETQ
ncbi:MAG: hypothetical protein ACYC8S_00370 [Minisyncoccota bacterium]